MTQKTMSEKDMYVASFKREYETTLRMLRAYPPDKSELKPAPNLKCARELAWMLVLNQSVVVPTLRGELKLGMFPDPPKTWSEVIAAFEREHRETLGKLGSLTDERMNDTIKLPVGPGKIGDVPISEALWMFFHDTIHHRGQLTVYARIAGGKIPSIYGPTADEPWS